MKFIKIGEVVYVNGLSDDILEEVDSIDDELTDAELLDGIMIITEGDLDEDCNFSR